MQESIRRYGVQVPIAVFRRRDGFVLIDGERRWRCVGKLNHKTIPALIQDEPGPLQNLLLMFNIHALREQWDLLTIALKLPTISKLLSQELDRTPTEADLSIYTALPRGVIRKCRLLTALPKKYTDILLSELSKPKSKQVVGEEFFIEMEKALGAVSRNLPDVMFDANTARDVLLKKYRSGAIESNIEFRRVTKIARAATVGADIGAATGAIRRLLSDPVYSISQAWNDTVSEAYAERDIVARIDLLLRKLNEVGSQEVDDDVRAKLEELVALATAVLQGSA